MMSVRYTAAAPVCLASPPCTVASSGMPRLVFMVSDRSRTITLQTGESRCTTLALYPAFARRLFTSSAIMTERCLPPVQPKAIVK